MAFFGGGASVDLASPPAIGNTTPNTGAFTTLSATPPANTTALNSTGYSLTGTNAQTLLNLAGTWNTTGTPTAFKLNVTDSASNASSLLMDLQVGGSSRFNFAKNGTLTCNANVKGSYLEADSATALVGFSSAAFRAGSARQVGWSSHTNAAFGLDVELWRDAASVLALRTGTTAQTFRLYKTYTDASNYERGFLRWASNVFEIGAEAAGTGTLRGLKIGTATTSLIGFYGVTPVDQPATVTDPTGGLTVDAEARTAINAIIDRLQELGLVA